MSVICTMVDSKPTPPDSDEHDATVREVPPELGEEVDRDMRQPPRKQIPTPRRQTRAEHPPSDGQQPRRTDLRDGDLDLAGLEEMIGVGVFEGVTEIDLSGNAFGDAGVAALCRSPHLSKLTVLRLAHNSLGDEALAALAGAAALTHLEVLDLSDNGIGPQGVAALAGSTHLLHLSELDLSRNPVGNTGAAALSRSTVLIGIKRLVLAQCQIGDAGMAAFGARTAMANTELLDLRGNGFGDKGAAEFARSQLVTNLKELRLSFNRIGPAGATALFQAGKLAPIHVLELNDNELGDKGAVAIARSFQLANLDRAVRAMMRPDVARLLFAEAVGIDAEGDAALRSFYESAAERLERALVLGQAMGVVRDGDMQVAARCLLGMLKEPVFEALLRGEDLDPERIVLELSRLLGVGLMKAPDA